MRRNAPMSQASSYSRRSCIVSISILSFVLVAFGLRLLYVTRISPYIDEFTSIWAAKLILQKGLPLTPAGAIYHRGILFSYVEALSTSLFGFSKEASRMPSVFIAVVTVPCLYLVGRRMLGDRSGLFAVAFLSFAPQAVVWGARARMYALLQLLALLAVYFLYAAIVESRKGIHLVLFVVFFTSAIFAQEQAVLLYPALLVAVAALGHWRWLTQRRGVLTNVVCCAAILSRYLLDRVGRPTQFELVQTAGSSLEPTAGLLSALRAYLSFFSHPDQILLSTLWILGSICALRAIASRGNSLGPRGKRWWESLAFLYVVFTLTVLEMLLAGGAPWSDPRYFFMVLPLFILGASATLERTLALIWERLPGARAEMIGSLPWPVIGSLLGLIAVVYLPGVNNILSHQVEGHDRAMEYVGNHWREGDVILMASPPVCAVYFDHCDYYAIQKGYEAYIVDREGQTVDVWTGAPLLNSVGQLKDALSQNDRVWFVVDGWRLATRYEIDFLQTVAEQMDTVEEVQGVKILLGEGYTSPERSAAHRSLEANLEDKVALLGYDLDTDCVSPEKEMCLTLYWQALAPLDREYTVFVHLLSREGSLVGQDDASPMAGLYPTIYWQEGETVPDRHCFVPYGDLPEDRYLLEVGMYLPETAHRLAVVDEAGNPIANRGVLDFLQVANRQRAMRWPSHTIGANLSDQILLLGYDLGDESSASDEAVLTTQPGATIPVTIHWQTLSPMDRDYTVFVHLLDQRGQIWGQSDGEPNQGFYPTSFWDVGETVLDRHDIMVDVSTPSGQYALVAGIYLLSTGERLPVIAEDDQVLGDEVFLTAVDVEKP